MTAARKERKDKRYRKVFSEVYADDKFSQLSPMQPSGQSLFLYLLTGPHCTNLPGVIVSGRAGLAEALGWELDDFIRCFAEIEALGMALADWKRRVVWLPKAIEHNKPESPNVVKSWSAHWREVPQCELKDRAARAILSGLTAYGDVYADPFRAMADIDEADDQENVLLKGYREGFPKGYREGCGPTTNMDGSHPSGNQEQEQEQEQEEEPTPILKPDVVAPATPTAAPARLRDVLPVERARRPHALDEAPLTTRLTAESLAALDAFVARYPRKDTPPKLMTEVWLTLNPSPPLAERILDDLRARLSRGWPGKDTPITKVKSAANWIREEHWTTPLPEPAAGATPARASLEGRSVTGECEACGGEIKGIIRNSDTDYTPCASCAKKAKAS